MSPRAACRLETLGFMAVYDFTAGKADWLAAGLPTEGAGASTPRPGRLAREAPTCGVGDTIATARDRAAGLGADRCVVVSETGVVLGVIAHDALAADGDLRAEEAIQEGPTTVRAHEELGGLLGRMHDRRVTQVLVTDPDGRLVGVLHRGDADAAIARPQGGGEGR